MNRSNICYILVLTELLLRWGNEDFTRSLALKVTAATLGGNDMPTKLLLGNQEEVSSVIGERKQLTHMVGSAMRMRYDQMKYLVLPENIVSLGIFPLSRMIVIVSTASQ